MGLQGGTMSLGVNIRLALVYLALTGMGVHCAEPQNRRSLDTADDSMELLPSGEWMAGSDEVRIPRSRSASRNHIVRRYTYSSLSSVPSRPTGIRQSSYSPQAAPLTGYTDPGPVTAVGSNYRPVKSQFGHWGTNQVESGPTTEGESARLMAVSEGISIMRERGDRQNPFTVVSSPAMKFVAGNQNSEQESASVETTRKPETKEETTTVGKPVARKPYKESTSGGVRYVVIKPPRRIIGDPYPLSSTKTKSQGQHSSSLVSSSLNAQRGKVNSTPAKSKHRQVAQRNNEKAQAVSSKVDYEAGKRNTGARFESGRYQTYKPLQASSSLTERLPSGTVPFREKIATPAGYQRHSKNVGPQMAARPDGLFDRHRSTGDVRKTTRVTSSPNYNMPSSSHRRVWTQQRVASTANVKPTDPANKLNQATVNKADVSHGDVSKPKKPTSLQSQGTSQQSKPQSSPLNTYSSLHSSSGVPASPAIRPNRVSSAGILGSYGGGQASENQYSKPPSTQYSKPPSTQYSKPKPKKPVTLQSQGTSLPSKPQSSPSVTYSSLHSSFGVSASPANRPNRVSSAGILGSYGNVQASENQYSKPPSTRYSKPPSTRYSKPPSTQYSKPSSTQYSKPSSAQYAKPKPKKPDTLQSQGTSLQSKPQSSPLMTYSSVYSSSGVPASPANRPNRVSSAGILGSYGGGQASENQYSKPPSTQYSKPPSTQYSKPPSTQYSKPPSTQYSKPPSTQYSRPSSAQYAKPKPKKPATSQSQGTSLQSKPQSSPLMTYSSVHSSSGVPASPANRPNRVSSAGVLGSYGGVQYSKPPLTQYSKPSTASSGKGQSMDTKVQQSEIPGKNPEPQSQVDPQHSSSSAKPEQNANIKISTVAHGSGQDHIPLTHTEDPESAFQTSPSQTNSGVPQSAPRQPEHTSTTQHQPFESVVYNQPSPDTYTSYLSGGLGSGVGVIERTKNSRYWPELSSSSSFLGQRYQNIKASHAALRDRFSPNFQISGQRGKPRKTGPLTAIVTGTADYSPKFDHQTAVEHVTSQGDGKFTNIETRFGYVAVPLAVTTVTSSTSSTISSDSTLTPAVLKKLSRMARLTPTLSPTSTYVLGTRVKPSSSSSSKKGKSLRKFKPVSLADIGGSATFRSKKTRAAPESIGNAAQRNQGNVSVVENTSWSPPAQQQMTTNDPTGVDVSRLIQTQSSTSTHVIGTRVKSSASSKKEKPLRKFKRVSLADIGSSFAFQSKTTRPVPESVARAALVNGSTLHSTSQFPLQQMTTTSDSTTAGKSRLNHQERNLLNAQEEGHQSDGPHLEQNQEVHQGSLQDIINIYGRFSPRSHSINDGSSQDEGKQTMVKPADLEDDGELVDGLSTNSSMSPPAAIAEDHREFNEGVQLDPSATNLTQSQKHSMAIIQSKPLKISDVILRAVKSASGPLSDVSDGVNHFQTVFNSTEMVQDEPVAGFHLETAENFASSPPPETEA